jgi:sterol desaturase/sphingolipid hydroxylase (fatty acid hydroxylase superfamily)
MDILFGTFHMPRDRQPSEFGVLSLDVPRGFWGQMVFPFRRTRRRPAAVPVSARPGIPA